MSKLSEDLRIGLLGAAAGLFSSSVTLLVDHVDAYYSSLSPIVEADQFCYQTGFTELWWIPVSFWHMLLSVVASFLVHRYLSNSVRSPFLLWQIIGITTLFGWGLTFFIGVSLECVMRGNLNPLVYMLSAIELANLAKYVSAAFACNVFYGSIINASSRQYAEPLDAEVT